MSERPSVADFLARSFGYCLVHENQIIGWCMSEYNNGNRCELGIETAAPFRRRGLAAESATAKQQPMTIWETLLLGLLKSMRRYELLRTPASQKMARVLHEEIRDYRDLELIINHLPPELVEAGEAEYGDPAVMSPKAMQAWIRGRKTAVAQTLDSRELQAGGSGA